MAQLRELGVDVWFNLGDRDLAIGLRRAQRLAEGATLTEAHRRAHARPRAGRARPADGRSAGAHPRPGPRALGALPGVHDPRARRGPGRRRRAPGGRGGARPAGRPRRDRRRARRDPRAVEPGHLGAHDPRGARASARRCARPRRPSSPSRPSSAARCSRARPRPSWRGPDCPRARRGRRAPTTACSTGWWPTSPSTACPRSQTDTLMDDAAARRRVAEDVLRFAESLRP